MTDRLSRNRTVTFENGETYHDVPLWVENYEQYTSYKNSPYGKEFTTIESDPEPMEPTEYGGFGRDVKRVFHSMVGHPANFFESVAPLNALLNPFKTAEDLYGDDFYELGVGDRMERVRETRAEYTDKSKIGSFLNPTTEELDRIVDEDGYTTSTETGWGFALDLGSYVAGAAGILNSLRGAAVNSPRAFRELIKRNKIKANTATAVVVGGATDQWLMNPNEGSFTSDAINVLDNLGWTNSQILAVGDWLTDPDVDAADKRLRMFLGNAPFEALLGLGLSHTRFGDDILPSDILDRKEAVEAAMKSLKRIKKEAPTGETTLPSGRVVDDAAEQAQVLNQEGTITGMVQKFTQSRGFNTYAGQDAFEQAGQAARKYRNRASHTAKRLQNSINNLLKTTGDKDIIPKIHEALTSVEVTIPSSINTRSEEKLINFLKSKFGFTDEVAKNVIESRRLVDEMSLEISKYAPTKAVRDTIKKNLNIYLNRSYRKFEDDDYVPTENVIAKAQQYFLRKFQEDDAFSVEEARKAGKKLTPKTSEQLVEKAVNAVDEIVRGEKPDVARKIFERRKDIAQPIRELLGEITDPEELLTITIDKMSKVYERDRFLKDMHELGTKQKWLFDSVPEGMDKTGKLVQLKGTGNSKLDGKWTTPRMRKVLMRKEVSLFGGEGEMNPFYANFLSGKALTNRAATIYNWGTQVKNFMGAAIIGLANGTNPFRTGILNKTLLNAPDYADDTNVHFGKTFKTIYNEISQGGDKALEELYEKYIGLGVINTNVRIGDFRALLEDGASSAHLTQLGNKLGKTISKKLGRGGNLATKVYMASDDFFKINAFNNELDFIKRANQGSGRTLESLEQEAADVVKNTVPNYDRVPKGIQALRNAPMGTFVSFPAEIIRVSYNIGKQSLKEMGRGLKGNLTYGARGAMRATGLAGTYVGFEKVGEYFYNKLGWSEDEYKAATQLTTTSWSGPENTRMFRQVGDKIFFTDTKFIDPLNTVSAPIRKALADYELGRLDEEGAGEAMTKAVGVALKELMIPFVSPAIATKTISDVYYAAESERGETPEGIRIFNPNADFGEKIADMSYHVLSSIVPKTILGIDKWMMAADEERDPYTGELKYDPDMAAQSFLTGIAWQEFNEENLLSHSITRFIDQTGGVQRGSERQPFASPTYTGSWGTLKEQFRDRQRVRHESQKELYKNIQASQFFRDDRDIVDQLMDRGISQDDAYELLAGRFIPPTISFGYLEKVSNKVGDAPEEWAIIRQELENTYADMSRTLLNTPTEED